LNVSITPTRTISGEVKAPPSKARTHRALFAGLLSSGRTVVHNPLSCNDTKATANAVSSLGARLEFGMERWSVEGNGVPCPPRDGIECGQSGVTLRFTIPIASLVGSEVRLKGSEGLMHRPLGPLIEAMGQLGVEVGVVGDEVRVKSGPPTGGRVRLPGNVSSQFISGLLLAGPLMNDGLEVELVTPLESCDYVSLTIETLKQHGIDVQTERGMSFFHVTPRQTYRATAHTIPGDYSSAAFLISAAAVTRSKLLITGLPPQESEPDSAFLNVLAQMGVVPEFSSEGLRVEGRRLKAAKVNIKNCPDLGPVLAVLGTYADGQTEITGAERLRFKESDRLAAITSELRTLGAKVEETDDSLLVSGPSALNGGTVESHDDHRIAMALAVAALNANNEVTIHGAECVNKSYPTFFDDIRALGVGVVER